MTYRITVVEDNEPDVFLLDDSLHQAGLDCLLTVLRDADGAREYIGGIDTVEAPHLLLLDMHLPRGDARELLSLIRARPAMERIPVVVWSSGPCAPEDQALQPAAMIMTKPSGYSEFLEIGRRLKGILEGV